MGGRAWQREPAVGDVIEVEPVEVSGANTVLARNPTGWGHNLVRVKDTDLDLAIPKETLWYIREGRGPFKLTEVTGTQPAEVVDKTNGMLTVQFVSEDRSKADSGGYEFDSPNRQSSTVWEGTPQRLDSGAARNRRRTLDHENRQGSKNDLLNGSL